MTSVVSTRGRQGDQAPLRSRRWDAIEETVIHARQERSRDAIARKLAEDTA